MVLHTLQQRLDIIFKELSQKELTTNGRMLLLISTMSYIPVLNLLEDKPSVDLIVLTMNCLSVESMTDVSLSKLQEAITKSFNENALKYVDIYLKIQVWYFNVTVNVKL